MASRKLVVELIGDASSLEKALKRAQSTTRSRGLSLGKSLAAGFGIGFGVAGVTAAIKTVIAEATEQEVAQRQLAAQFKANKQNLADYNAEITTSINKLSLLAGIEDDEILSAFTLAFRATKNVTEALRLTAIGADVAKARHTSLATAVIALNKAYGGNVGALRRLGITIPNTLEGMEALDFISRRFAGQAEAGTTAQDRFNVALKNMEQVIGTALLPTFNDLADRLAKWIGDERNQKRVQEDVNEALRLGGEALDALKTAFEDLRAVIQPIDKALGGIDVQAGLAAASVLLLRKQLIALGLVRFAPITIPIALAFELPGSPLKGGFNDQAKKLFHDIARAASGDSGASLDVVKDIVKVLGTHHDTLPKGQSPIGENALPGGPGGTAVAVATTVAKTTSKNLSLVAKINRARLAEAKALLTKSQADDRAALVLEASLLREGINSHRKHFKDKEALYRQLAGVEGQIQSIDDDASQKRIDAQEKAAARAKKAADRERAARKKARDAAARAAKEALAAAKQTAKDFRELIATERERIGALFGGPVFDPSDAQRKAALGAPTPGSNVKLLIADLKAQLTQFKAFERDLKTLAKRGAPPQLLTELRQGGLAVAPQVHALATAGGGSFAEFKRLFIQRQQLAVDAAKQARPIINLTVIVDRDTGKVSVKTTPHGQKRGRNPGLVLNKGAVLS